MRSLAQRILASLKTYWLLYVLTGALSALAISNCWTMYQYQLAIHKDRYVRTDPARRTWLCEQLYLEQADAFLHGRLDIAHPDLDSVYYPPRGQGKYYVPYLPTPALIYLPLVALAGTDLSIAYLVIAFLTLFNVLNLDAIGRRLGLAVADRWWLSLAFFFGTGYWFCVTYSFSAAYTSHVITCTFLLAAIRESLSRTRGWALGILYGAMVTTRPMTIFIVPFLLAALWCRHQPKGFWRGMVPQVLLMGLAGAPFAVMAALFNYYRFHNVLEIGYSWTPFNHNMPFLSARYLPRNLYYMFVHGMTFEIWGPGGFTDYRVSGWGTSLLHASPFLILAFCARLRAPLVLGAWAAIIPTMLAICMCIFAGYFQINCQRYAFDFLALWFFLAMIGYRGQVEKNNRRIWIGLICWSIGLNVAMLGLLPTINQCLSAYARLFWQ